MTSQMLTYIAVALGVLVLLGIIALVVRRARTYALERRFGKEYEHTLKLTGDRKEAERELLARQQRVRSLHIEELPNSARFRYAAQWRAVQNSFVDEPRKAIDGAEELVTKVMRDRGYPAETFDQRVEDLSPDHPDTVDDYRQAHDVAVRVIRGEVSTEEMRRALVQYRSIFDELVGQHVRK